MTQPSPPPRAWEEMVALNPHFDEEPTAIGLPADHATDAPTGHERLDALREIAREAVARDPWPLPDTKAREGYYGANHWAYWLSGLADHLLALRIAREEGVEPACVFELGAATGRVTRHFAAQMPRAEVHCADINLAHVRWVNRFLDPRIVVHQNHSIPTLPYESGRFDLVTAYSVFSHVEAFDQAWLLELRRILRPGGLLLMTANVDNWELVTEGWPVFRALRNHPRFDPAMLGRPLPAPRVVFRWRSDASYTSNVFMRRDYVEREWAPIMPLVRLERHPGQNQSLLLFRKA